MKKVVKKILIIISLIVLILGSAYIIRRNNYIYLTQFGATTSRQMMGYAIKTKNSEIVLIDSNNDNEGPGENQLFNFLV